MDFDMQQCGRFLQSCKTIDHITQGRQIHNVLLKKGILTSALTMLNRLLQMYGRCGHMSDARKLFDQMPRRNVFSWNTIIEGFMKCGEKDKCLAIFNSMPEKNDFSWNVVLSGFSKTGELDIARRLFDDMPRKNCVAWNSMIHGYVRNGHSGEAIKLFKELNSCSDLFVSATVIGACTDIEALKCGKQIHARILIDGVKCDSVLASALTNLYAKCGDLIMAKNISHSVDKLNEFSLSALISGYADFGKMNDARRIFDERRNECVVLWNSLLSGYVSNNLETQAFFLFNEMRQKGVLEDSSTIASVLSACSGLGLLEQGKQIHCHAYKYGSLDDAVVAGALLDMYSKCLSLSDACNLISELKVCDTILLNSMITIYSNCGRIEDAKHIFEKISKKTLVSWNSMIVGLNQNGSPVDALDLFCQMNELDLPMDKITLASAISACGSISYLELGQKIFARSFVIGLDEDQIIGSSLIDFYCKCGFIELGRKIFEMMEKSDIISWNSMLMGYATNGLGFKALDLFKEMREAGVRPTDITFTGVLSACDHCGLVEEGRKWFDVMKRDYKINPRVEHYSCMIDLLARAGFLEESIDLAESMPFDADVSMWSSILRGCIAHGPKGIAKRVAEKIIEIDPDNSGAYVQLSGMFARSGDWERSAMLRKLMRDKNVKKNPGSSWSDCC